MTVDHPYPVFGQADDGTSPIVGATIYIKDETTDQGTTNVTSDANGAYVIDIADYASDGDTILVWGFYNGNYGLTSFTLDISGAAEQIDFSITPFALSDTLTIADTIATVGSYTRSLTDSLTISDTISTVGTYARSLTDTLSISDTIATVGEYTRSLTDTLTIADTIATVGTYTLSLTDTLAITDTLSVVGTYILSLTDTLAIADTLVTVHTVGVAAQILDYIKLTSAAEQAYKLSSNEEQAYKLSSNEEQPFKITKIKL